MAGSGAALRERAVIQAAPGRRTMFARGLASVALAVAVVTLAVPFTTGVAWSDIAAAMTSVSRAELLGLSALWAAGLLAFSFVLTGALPGLSRRRALTLNLTGSAVSNLVPMGGAVGTTLNLAMVRSWKFRPSSFASFAVVTNIWDVLGKLALPSLACLGILVAGDLSSPALKATAVTASTVLVLVLAAVVAALRSERCAVLLGRGVVAVATRMVPARVAGRVTGLERGLHETRAQVRGLISARWPQLTAGTACYLGLQGCLLWACVHAVGGTLSAPVVLAGLAVERLLSLAVVTPGGIGLAEAGTGGVLVALGVDPLTAATGIVLYRAFTFLLEIPVGGLWLGGWLVARSLRHGSS